MSWLSSIFSPAARTRKTAGSAIPFQRWILEMQPVIGSLKLNVGADIVVTPIANTNSMIPTMDDNCVLLLEKVPFESLQEGDIVTYRGNPAVWGTSRPSICHRLNEKTARGWWPLGDGNTKMDPELVTPENFDRRVCGILYGRRLETTDR